MDDRMLAKLNILLKKDPKLGEFLREQTEAVSDEELEAITGGDKCEFSSPCWEDTACQWDASLAHP